MCVITDRSIVSDKQLKMGSIQQYKYMSSVPIYQNEP